jgi:PAS domain S-box-containing protein
MTDELASMPVSELSAFETASLPMMLARFDGSVLRVNRAWTQAFGYTTTDLHGVSPLDVTNLAASTLDTSLEILSSSGNVREPFIVHTKRGRNVAVNLSAQAVPDESGTPLCILATFVPLAGRAAK